MACKLEYPEEIFLHYYYRHPSWLIFSIMLLSKCQCVTLIFALFWRFEQYVASHLDTFDVDGGLVVVVMVMMIMVVIMMMVTVDHLCDSCDENHKFWCWWCEDLLDVKIGRRTIEKNLHLILEIRKSFVRKLLWNQILRLKVPIYIAMSKDDWQFWLTMRMIIAMKTMDYDHCYWDFDNEED